MPLHHLTHSRILHLAPTTIEGTLRDGTRTTHVRDTVVLARVREISSVVHFLYRGQSITTFGSWIGLTPALDEAEALSRQYQLTPQTDGRLEIRTTVEDRTVRLVRPDRYTTLTLPYEDGTPLDTIITEHPDHQAVSHSDLVIWHSARSADENLRSIQEFRTRYEADGDWSQTLLPKVRALFSSLPA